MHIELWNWAYENPQLEKCQWPRWEERGGDVEVGQDCYCFACEWDCIRGEELKSADCDSCPMNWSGKFFDTMKQKEVAHCRAANSEFRLWELAKGDYPERRRLADIIRNMPWDYR